MTFSHEILSMRTRSLVQAVKINFLCGVPGLVLRVKMMRSVISGQLGVDFLLLSVSRGSPASDFGLWRFSGSPVMEGDAGLAYGSGFSL